MLQAGNSLDESLNSQRKSFQYAGESARRIKQIDQ